MSGYEVASLTGMESLPGPGSLRWTPIRKHFGITAFGINAYTATEAGQDVVEEHNEARLGHEELYVVARRAGRRSCSTATRSTCPPGSAVFLRDPAMKRCARAEEAGTTVLALGGKPRQASRSRRGSTSSPRTRRPTSATTTERSREIDAGLQSGPTHPPLLYHWAACIARGRAGCDEARAELDARSSSSRRPAGCRREDLADQDEDLASRYASPGSRRPRGALAQLRDRIGLRAAATTSTAPKPSPASASTSELQPERERERLVRLLAAERDELVRRARRRAARRRT